MSLFAITFVLCALSCGCVFSDNDDWDYLVFTQEWPATFCKYAKCTFPADKVNNWNIHGLWPSNSEGKDPFYCEGAPAFDINKLKSIYNQLQIEWADLKGFDNPAEFWQYEWKKHGTCAIQDPIMPDELNYFISALKLKGKAAIQKILLNSGVVPSDDKQYYGSQITNAIRQSLQITPKLTCIMLDDVLYLSQIEICSDKNFSFINCPKRKHEDVNLAKSFVNDIFKNIRLLLSLKPSKKPVNRPCNEDPFQLPIISANQTL